MALPVINDGVVLKNIDADSAVFNLVGGYYAMTCVASLFSANVALMALAGDGTTFVPVADVAFTDNGMITGFLLPPGAYLIAVDSSTAVYVQLARINI